MTTGFIDRFKGKIWQNSASQEQFGGGAAVDYGGGQINSTASCSTAGGVALSTAGTSETSLLAYTLPAKSMDRLGRNVTIQAWGTFSTSNAGAKTAKLYFGSQSVAIQNSTTVTTLQPWWLELNVFQNQVGSTIGGQTIFSQQILSSSHGGITVSTGSENVLANSTIKVTGISSSPTIAGDVIALGMQVTGMN